MLPFGGERNDNIAINSDVVFVNDEVLGKFTIRLLIAKPNFYRTNGFAVAREVFDCRADELLEFHYSGIGLKIAAWARCAALRARTPDQKHR